MIFNNITKNTVHSIYSIQKIEIESINGHSQQLQQSKNYFHMTLSNDFFEAVGRRDFLIKIINFESKS